MSRENLVRGYNSNYYLSKTHCLWEGKGLPKITSTRITLCCLSIILTKYYTFCAFTIKTLLRYSFKEKNKYSIKAGKYIGFE